MGSSFLRPAAPAWVWSVPTGAGGGAWARRVSSLHLTGSAEGPRSVPYKSRHYSIQLQDTDMPWLPHTPWGLAAPFLQSPLYLLHTAHFCCIFLSDSCKGKSEGRAGFAGGPLTEQGRLLARWRSADPQAAVPVPLWRTYPSMVVPFPSSQKSVLSFQKIGQSVMPKGSGSVFQVV